MRRFLRGVLELLDVDPIGTIFIVIIVLCVIALVVSQIGIARGGF